MKIPALYVCGTPIGNLSDVTLRLLEILNSVDVILCEDTRVTRGLLQRHGIHSQLVRCDQHHEALAAQFAIEKLTQGASLAMVTDAGTPCISDPGYKLVAAVRSAGHPVIVIPGPSAPIALLSIAGIDTQRYLFWGFAPKKHSEWSIMCDRVREMRLPLVFFESPNRIHASLQWLRDYDPLAQVVLGKELTKTFETVLTGTPKDLLDLDYGWNRGEWSAVVTFSEKVASKNILESVDKLRSYGCTNRQIVDICKNMLQINKNEVYRLLVTDNAD